MLRRREITSQEGKIQAPLNPLIPNFNIHFLLSVLCISLIYLFIYLFIYLSSAKNILHKAKKGHNINKYKNTGRGDATAMPITALPALLVLVRRVCANIKTFHVW